MEQTDNPGHRPDGIGERSERELWPLVRFDQQAKVLECSPHWAILTGSSESEDCWAAVHVHDRQRLLDEISFALAKGISLNTTARLRRADAVYRHVPLLLDSPSDSSAQDGRWLRCPQPVAQQATAIAAKQATPTTASVTPAALTSLFHRMARQNALDRRRGQISAFVSLGPIAWSTPDKSADPTLIRRLAKLLRRSDLIAAPVDEPTVIMITDLGAEPDTAAVNAGDIALKVVRWLREHLTAATSLNASIVMFSGRTDWSKQLEEAELARTRARGSPDLVVFVDPALQRAARERERLISDLRRAVDARSFVLQYQPMVGRSGHLAGVEALLRWHRRGADGLQFPSQFLTTAEQAGLMQELGRWVLESACGRYPQWQQQLGGALSMSINVGATEFNAPGYVEFACDLIAKTGLSSGAVALEMPGEILSGPSPRTLQALGQLRAAGFTIVFDGYGEDGLDLMALRELPVDAIKLDSRYLVERAGSKVGATMTQAVVSVAHSLGVDVQAKAIETREQLDLFVDSGCDAFQGRLLGEPSASTKSLARAGFALA